MLLSANHGQNTEHRRLEEPLAFLSPCLLKKNKFITKSNEELVRYNITVHGLRTWLAEEAVDIQRCAPRRPVTTAVG
jgi:hypothetical protein